MMSIDFSGTARYENASGVVTDYPCTMACWFNPDTFGTNTTLGLGSATANAMQRVYVNSTAVHADSWNLGTGATASTTAAPSTGSWQHAAGVFASATDRRAFLNGGNKGTNATSKTWNANLNTTLIGQRRYAGTYGQGFDGKLAECAIWDVALTDADILALSTGIRPSLVRPESLIFYVPLIREVLDFRGGLSLTATGSPTVADHCRRIA